MVQGLTYCDLHSYWHCIPGAQTEGERWTWEGMNLGMPKKSPEVLRWTWPPQTSHCVWLPRATYSHLTTLLVTCGQAQTWTLVTKTYTISGVVPGQLLRSTNQTASTLLHRPALWTELSCSQKTRVLGTQHHVQQTLRSTHDLTMRRGLMLSFTQRLPGIGFQLSQVHAKQ